MATPRNIQGDLKRIRDNEVSVSSAISYLKEFVKRKFNEIIDIQDHKFKADALIRSRDITPRMLDFDAGTPQFSVKDAFVLVNVDGNPNKLSIEPGLFFNHSFYAKDRKTIKAIKDALMPYDPSRSWIISLTSITLPNNNGHFLYVKIPVIEGVGTSEVLVDEGHIDPLRDDNYVIYPKGYLHPVKDGLREFSPWLGNAKGGAIIHNKTKLKDGGSELLNQFYHLTLAQFNKLHNPATIDPASADTLEFNNEQVLKFKGTSITPDTPIININDGSATESVIVYGFLYNPYTFLDPRGLPTGKAHIPTREEWKTLIFSIDPTDYPDGREGNTAGGKLKEVGTTNWFEPNTGATDEFEFHARGTGSRYDGDFSLKKVEGGWWTRTPYEDDPDNNMWAVGCVYNYAFSDIIAFCPSITTGLGIRFIVDEPIDIVGNHAKYIGTDLTEYDCVLMPDGNWWMAVNLMETLYANGDEIPEVQSNMEWNNSGYGMRCSYANLPENAAIQAAAATPVTIGGTITIPANRAPLDSPEFTGTPKVPTPITSNNSTQIANTAFVKAVIAELINASPSTMDTLAEIATALGDDPNFATTITDLIGSKLNAAFDNITDPVAARSALGLGAVALLASIGITDITGLTAALAGKQATMTAGTHYLTPEQIASNYASISVLNDIETILASI